MEFNKPYVSIKVAKDFSAGGVTKQSFKDECDITKILGKFQRTGIMDFVNKAEPQYGEFSGFDLAQSMNAVIRAQEMFADMPAHLRKAFNNDPAEFLNFVDDPANRDRAIELGLIQAPAQSAPSPVGASGGEQGATAAPKQ